MKSRLIVILFFIAPSVFLFSKCSDIGKDQHNAPSQSFGGFNSQIEWGEHLVKIGACHDCHTPKKMTPNGMEMDNSLLLSGHPANQPPPDIDLKEAESKGLIATQDLTAWAGPWGVSYAANLTPDATGIASWQESNFFTAIREGKYKGMPSGRQLLPPMPWDQYKNMTDDEIKAVFAYLKSIKPVNNLVPQPLPPVSSQK